MPAPERKWPLAALAAILLLAAFFRFYLITEIPPGLYPDEAANGNNAVEALRTGEFKIFYPENNGREGLYINLQALSLSALGVEPWALRVVSAVFGTLTVLGIYLLAKELFRESGNTAKRAALLSAFFLATSFWHINFSRIGFRAILVPFFAVFAVFWLLKALRTGKISSALAGGIATGLGLHTYIAFRFMPFVLAVPMFASLRAWLRGKAEPCAPCVIALFLFAALIAALPLGIYFLQHPADFFGRSAQVSVFSAESPLLAFAKSNLLTLGMLNIRGDCNPRHNLNCQPQLFWPVGVLFLIGFALTIRGALWREQKFQIIGTKTQINHKSPIPKHKRFGIWDLGFGISRSTSWTLLAWLAFMTLPATLTREGLPHALRAIGLVPPVMILAGLGGAALWQGAIGFLTRALRARTYAASRNQLQRIRTELTLAAVLFLIWLPVVAYRDYFIRFAQAPATRDAFAHDLWSAGQYLARLPDGVEKFVIVNLSGDDIRGAPAPAQTVMFATDTFDAAGRAKKRLTYVTRPEDITRGDGAEAVIVPLNAADAALLITLRKRFPDFRERRVGDVAVFRHRSE